MHFEDYPELTEVIKKYLLDKAFTKGRYSVDLNEIAAYLDDKDIAIKATKLPTERFKKILSVYAIAWRHKMKDCNKGHLHIEVNKAYTRKVMITAARMWALDLLWKAVDLDIPAPQETNDIKRTNAARRELYTAQMKRGIEEDKPVDEVTFNSFMKENRNTLVPYMQEHWKIDSQDSSVSKDRETRIYPNEVKTAEELYSKMHRDKLTKEDKMTFLREEKRQITQGILSQYRQVTECSKAWEKAIHHMADLEQKHKEHLKQN